MGNGRRHCLANQSQCSIGTFRIPVCLVIVVCLVTFLVIVAICLLFIVKNESPILQTDEPEANVEVEEITPTLETHWKVEYNLPVEVSLIKYKAEDLKGLMICPHSKFALELNVEFDLDLAGAWLRACGDNLEYFKITGSYTSDDRESLKDLIKPVPGIPLKAILRLKEGVEVLHIPQFPDQSIIEDINSVEISGHVAPKMIEELVTVLPYIEELDIKGSEICSSLKRSVVTSKKGCIVNWQFLRELRVSDTLECKGLYDLIYSCWNIPKIDIISIHNSIIDNSIAEHVFKIVDRYKIVNVDFADNSCFDEVMQTHPNICQAKFRGVEMDFI